MDESEFQMDATLLQSPAEARKAAEAEKRGRQALRERSDSWDAAHEKRVGQLTAELLRDSPDAGADEKLLVRLAAAEAALFERLEVLQVQLAERAVLLIDAPSHVLLITKALKDAVAVSSAVGRRIESVLGTTSVLRAQRELTGARPSSRAHLRVA